MAEEAESSEKLRIASQYLRSMDAILDCYYLVINIYPEVYNLRRFRGVTSTRRLTIWRDTVWKLAALLQPHDATVELPQEDEIENMEKLKIYTEKIIANDSLKQLTNYMKIAGVPPGNAILEKFKR